jgi:hypothetical protein
MKSKKEDSHYHTVTFSWVKIYLEDIDEIIKIMNDEGKAVEISDQSF